MASVAAVLKPLEFWRMSEAELRQWVEANPGRVNDRDRYGGFTPLIAAALNDKHSLVVWLLDKKGADVNATTAGERTAIFYAETPDILTTLLDRGADPNVADAHGTRPLMLRAFLGQIDNVARLLEDPRVRVTVNMQSGNGLTVLHRACDSYKPEERAALMVHLLLQAGANPTTADNGGETPLDMVRQSYPGRHATIALLEQTLAEAEKTSLLVKARRLAVAATSNVVTPSCLQGRVVRGQALPRVMFAPLTDGPTDNEHEEESRKLRITLASLTGLGSKAMPRDVFRVVMGFLMPSWDPLRRTAASTGQPL
jgi:hypothetical protein